MVASGSCSSCDNKSSMRRFVFLGAPGVGKGTFATILSKRLQVPAVSAGDVLREHIAAGGPHAAELKSYTSQGRLVPDKLVLSLVSQRLLSDDCANGFILDGLPRNLAQAEVLEQTVNIDRVVDIRVERWVAVKKMLGRRICRTCKRSFNVESVMAPPYDMPAILPDPETCPKRPNCNPVLDQRDDDKIDVIQHRFDVYDREVQPLLDFYQQRLLLKTFVVHKGVKDADALFECMMSPVEKQN